MATLQRSHEALCLDSLHHRFYWRDDFEGDTIKDEWTQTLTAGGSIDLQDSQDGGVVRLSGAVDADGCSLDWNDIRSITTNNAPIKFEVGVISRFSAANGLIFSAALSGFDGAQNYLVRFSILDGYTDQWTMRLYNGGNNSGNLYSGVAYGVNTYHVLTFIIYPDREKVRFFINGTETNSSPFTDTTDIPIGAKPMQPLLNFDCADDGARYIDIDYVEIQQLREALT